MTMIILIVILSIVGYLWYKSVFTDIENQI